MLSWRATRVRIISKFCHRLINHWSPCHKTTDSVFQPATRLGRHGIALSRRFATAEPAFVSRSIGAASTNVDSLQASPPRESTIHAAHARHILRALLRECSYLPDSHARKWLHQHVLQRFRRHAFESEQSQRNPDGYNDPDSEKRIAARLRQGRQAAHRLHRANEGDRKALLTVLLMAYGRTGKRRHSLMVPLLSVAEQGEAGTTAGSGPLTPSAEDVNAGRWTPYVPDLTPQMRALLASQIKHPPPHLTRPTLRRMQPRIEKLNTWLTPMPRSRVKNMTKEWYATLLDRAHPPLPGREWERLRDLANGTATESVPPRRAVVSDNKPSALDLVLKYGKPNPHRAFQNPDIHRITPRFMQRLWAQVFAQCPRIDWNYETQRWDVEWGGHALYCLQPNKGRRKDLLETWEGVSN